MPHLTYFLFFYTIDKRLGYTTQVSKLRPRPDFKSFSEKVDFFGPFLSVFCYISPIFGRIYRSNYQNIIRKNVLYIFPQKNREKIFFPKIFFYPIFHIFR